MLDVSIGFGINVIVSPPQDNWGIEKSDVGLSVGK